MEEFISIQQALSIINILHSRPILSKSFTSHDFIGEYVKQYESDYIDLLVRFQSPTGNYAFQKVNALIGKYLSVHREDLHIVPIEKTKDTNIHHIETDNQRWSYEIR